MTKIKNKGLREKLFLFILLVFIWSGFTYQYPCEYGQCRYDFRWDTENPQRNYLRIMAFPIQNIEHYCCSWQEGNTIYQDNNIQTENCHLPKKMVRCSVTETSEHKWIIHDIKLHPTTIKNLEGR